MPLIPAARELLTGLREANLSVKPEHRVLQVRECQRAMDRAAALVKFPRITHPMKTYGHLRDEHSQTSAAKIRFVVPQTAKKLPTNE